MKEILKKINYFFKSRVRNQRTSPELSKIINLYLDDPETEIIISSKYNCTLKNSKFNKLNLWIGNYPYAYGSLSPYYTELTLEGHETYTKLHFIFGEKLPDRKTVYRLHEAVENKKKELGYYPDSAYDRVKEILNV